MSADAVLSELEPLRLPEPLGWWPPAPAVWLLFVLVVLLAVLVVAIALRRQRQRAYRREAAAALQALFERWRADRQTARYLAEANRLLKAVALRVAPADEVASLSGADWQRWLEQRAPKLQDPDPRWVDSWYRVDGAPEDLRVDALHQYFRDWVGQHV